MPLFARPHAAGIVLALVMLAPAASAASETDRFQRSVGAIMTTRDPDATAGPRILPPRFLTPRGRLGLGPSSTRAGAHVAAGTSRPGPGGVSAPQTLGDEVDRAVREELRARGLSWDRGCAGHGSEPFVRWRRAASAPALMTV